MWVGNDRAMRVAYDCHSLLTSPTGVARYTRRLADALRDAGVDLAPYAIGWNGTPPDGVPHWRLPNPIVHRTWRYLGFPTVRRMTGEVDLVHGTEFVLPPLGRVPGVVTLHDLSFARDDSFPGARRLRAMVPWTLARARRVIVPSEAVASELHAHFGHVEGVRVIHEGVGREFASAAPLDDDALARMGVRRPFALVVGELQPRKNLPRLLDAWTRVRDALPEWSLVVAGPAGWGPSLPETPGCSLVGWVPDADLPRLMAAAEIFVYPSLYEGFGLPPLEAMAAGTAVLAGDYGPARELLGDAARVVDRHSARAIADELVALARDDGGRSALAGRGRLRARDYTWERAAQQTRDCYEEAVAGT